MSPHHETQPVVLALSCALAAPALAEDVVHVPDVPVQASPIIEEVHIDAYSSVSDVVTEEQLRDQNAVDLMSALRRTPGVQISRYNPVGAYGGDQGGAVFIRGLGLSRPGSEIKTYVDGVPLYVGVWGHPAIDLLPINGMESITVYKSPQPQVNGNNFASINLETREAREEGLHGDVRMSAGSFDTVIEQFNLFGKQGPLDFMLAQGYTSSNGDRDNAEGDLRNVMGKVGVQFNEHWKASVSFLIARNNVNDPGDSRQPELNPTPEYISKTNLVTLGLSHQHGDWKGDFKIYHNDGQSDLHDDAVWGTFISGFEMSGLKWQEEFSPWTGGTITAGLDIDRTSGDVRGKFTGDIPPFFLGPGIPVIGNVKIDVPEFRVTSPYLAMSQEVKLNEAWSLVPSAGLRFYEHNKFESKTAPHAGLALASDTVTLFANISRGINYPGLEAPALQAALPFLFTGVAWDQLSPEEDRHQEIGAKFTPRASTQIDVSLFQDHIKNRYIYDPAVGTAYFNAGNYRMNGAELSIKQNINTNWVVFAGLTLLDPSINHLPYTPEKAFTAGLNGKLGPLNLAVDAQYQDEVWALNRDRNNNPATLNTQKVDSFAIVNARVSYPLAALGKKGEVFLAVENLFDREYEYRPGYEMPGVSGQLGFSASF